DRSSSDFIDQYVDYNYRDGYTWQITEDGMECIDCPKPTEEELAWEDLRDFDQLDIHGIFDVRIHRGDAFSVELKGPESEKKKYNIYRTGKTLVIDFEGKKRFDWNWKKEKVLNDKVYISVTMPDVGEIKATGFGSIDFDEFTGDEIEFSLRGPIEAKGKLNADHVRIDLAAKSELELEGRDQRMSADLESAS